MALINIYLIVQKLGGIYLFTMNRKNVVKAAKIGTMILPTVMMLSMVTIDANATGCFRGLWSRVTGFFSRYFGSGDRSSNLVKIDGPGGYKIDLSKVPSPGGVIGDPVYSTRRVDVRATVDSFLRSSSGTGTGSNVTVTTTGTGPKTPIILESTKL